MARPYSWLSILPLCSFICLLNLFEFFGIYDDTARLLSILLIGTFMFAGHVAVTIFTCADSCRIFPVPMDKNNNSSTDDASNAQVDSENPQGAGVPPNQETALVQNSDDSLPAQDVMGGNTCICACSTHGWQQFLQYFMLALHAIAMGVYLAFTHDVRLQRVVVFVFDFVLVALAGFAALVKTMVDTEQGDSRKITNDTGKNQA